MQLIIGLGNPGKEYENTRHNAGFILIDKIREVCHFTDFKFNKKFNAELSKGNISSQEALLIKPQTFMNNSGDSARNILEFYKLTSDDLVVIHDDIDIALGEFRIATDSRSAGHNGVQDIIDKIGTQRFKRVRIGIRPEKNKIHDAADFVLQKFTEEELEKIEKISQNALDEIRKIP